MEDRSLWVYAASSVVAPQRAVRRAQRRLGNLGFDVCVDDSVRHRHQRFAGTDDERVQALHRVASAAPAVALAARGGYGLTRILDAVNWKALSRSVEKGTRWVGYSDLTALQLAMFRHTAQVSWHGPMALDDFGYEPTDDALVEAWRHVTAECFSEAMSGELEAVGFRTETGFDGLARRGTLWGGNLAMVCSLLGTPHWPDAAHGILFLEDVGEHPYRVERMLLQLLQAGVLQRQRAVILGQFTQWKASPLDRGYGLKAVVAHLRGCTKTPVLTGLPFGHVPLKVCLPIGCQARLVVQGRDALIAWGD